MGLQYLTDITIWNNGLALCLRLVLAAACGAAIGFERKRNFKSAGLRTHILVCCGAALFMIISKYGFLDLLAADGTMMYGTEGADPSRIASQVVCGIGFLGAGVIFKNGGSIKGLTTAAGLWMTAGVGMAVGSGMLIIGIFAAAFVVVLQLAMHRHSIGVDNYAITKIRMIVQNNDDATNIIEELTRRSRGVVSSSSITRKPDNTTEYNLSLKVPGDLSYDRIEKFMNEHDEIESIDIVS